MPKHSYKPKAQEIDRLRLKQGWALPDLAVKACVSKRTIDKIMQGNKVVISTIRKIAKALEVSPEELLEGYQRETVNEMKNGWRFVIAFGIRYRFENAECKELDFDDFDETTDLQAFIEKLTKLLAPLAGPIKEMGVDKGSVIIRLEMDKIDIIKMLGLFMQRDHEIHELFQSVQILATEEEFQEKDNQHEYSLPREYFQSSK